MFIPFGPLQSDLEPLGNEGALRALNVVPDGRSYRPLRAPVPIGSALGSRPLTATSFVDTPSGSNFTIAGTAATLERLVNGAWQQLASGFTANSRSGWAFQPFGRNLIAAPGNAELRRIDLDTNAVTTIDGSPQLTCMAVVRDFLVGGAGQYFHNSAINNALIWSGSMANSKLLPTGGVITGVVGGERGTIFQETSIRLLTFNPGLGDGAFQIDEIETDHGCSVPGSLIKYRSNAFYLARNGFYAFSGGGSTPIGDNRIDKTFWRTVDEAQIDNMRATIDPINKLVVWSYPTRNAPVAGLCDRLLIFNYEQARWSEADVESELLLSYVTPGITTDSPGHSDIDASNDLVDSRIFLGGTPILSIVGRDHRIATLTGSTLAASLQTGEVEIGIKDKAVHLQHGRTVVDGAKGALSAQIREHIADDLRTVGTTRFEDRKVHDFDRERCRFARFQVDIAAGESWDNARGVTIDRAADGGGA